MIKDITLGQYFPGKSVIHRLDPRIKLLLTLIYIVMLFAASGFLGLGVGIVFLTAAYWFFDLINSDIFSFAEPLALSITDFVRIYYDREVEVGGVYVDGTLLLFDIIAKPMQSMYSDLLSLNSCLFILFACAFRK